MTVLWNIGMLTVAIIIVAKLLPGIHLKSMFTALIVALVYSILNFLFGWLLFLITLPAIIITFGLFKFVLNAFLLWVTDKIMEDFKIDSLGTTLVAAFLITVIDSIFRWIL